MKVVYMFLVALLFLPSCSVQKLPVYLENPAKHPKYKNLDYITAVGISLDGQKDAELQAKAAIASQLKASIKASTTTIIEEIRNNKETASTQDIFNKISVETDFDSAELIQMDYNSSQKFEGKYYIFAYLKKENLLEKYFKEYEKTSQLFQTNVKQADAAFTNRDYQLFKNNFKEAVVLMAELYKSYFLIKAIYQEKPFEKQLENEKFYYELLKKKATWRDYLSFYLDLKGSFSSDKKEFWVNLFETLFNRLKLKISPENSCKINESGANILRVNPKEVCTEGSFGPICRLELKGALINCQSNDIVFEFDFSALKLEGSNAKERSKALKAAYNTVELQKIEPIFKDKMKDYFPVE